jgi:hypothetical protein
MRTITPAEFKHYAAEHGIELTYPAPLKPQPKGTDERPIVVAGPSSGDWMSAIFASMQKLRDLLKLTPKAELDDFYRRLASSFVATLCEDELAACLVSLLAIPGLSELLDRHLGDAISHVEHVFSVAEERKL